MSAARLTRSLIGQASRAGPSTFAQPVFSSVVARRWLSEASKAKLDKAVASSPVILFMKGTPQVPQCGFSRAAIQVLEMSNVPQDKIKTFNVLADDELRTDIKEYSSWPTIPQLYVNGEFIGGCDILLSQYKDGSLAELFQKEGIVAAEQA